MEYSRTFRHTTVSDNDKSCESRLPVWPSHKGRWPLYEGQTCFIFLNSFRKKSCLKNKRLAELLRDEKHKNVWSIYYGHMLSGVSKNLPSDTMGTRYTLCHIVTTFSGCLLTDIHHVNSLTPHSVQQLQQQHDPLHLGRMRTCWDPGTCSLAKMAVA
jgi:hypothetical protein